MSVKTLRKHIHAGGLVWGGGEGGEGGGCRLQRSYWQKAVVNKRVLSLDLNSGRVEEFLRPDGREFQTEGARKLKERSPNVLVLRFGTFRSFSHDERKNKSECFQKPFICSRCKFGWFRE